MFVPVRAARLMQASLMTFALASCAHAPRQNIPDASAIRFAQGRAVPPECARLVEPAFLVDAGHHRPGVAFGCATYTNLASMVARPEDFVVPLPYAGTDAAVAAAAVRRFEEDRIKQPAAPASTTAPMPRTTR